MEPQIQQAELQSASSWRRFFNLVIDIFLYYLASFCWGFMLGILGLARSFTESPYAARLILAYALLFLYYFAFEALFQRTPGKFITGTKVVMAGGGKPTLGTIAVRTLSRFVPFEPISAYTGKDEDKKRTWWHDRWTRTRVVRA